MEEKYYISIKEKILQSEIYDKARDYAKDRNKVKVYFEIGKLLSNAGKDYGKNIIKQYENISIKPLISESFQRNIIKYKYTIYVFTSKLMPITVG